MTEVTARVGTLISRVKGLFGVRSSRIDNFGRYDLSDRVFTKAMLLRAAAAADALDKNLKLMGRKLKSPEEPKDLNDMIKDAACSAAFHITTDAMTSIKRGMFMPFEPLPEDASRVLAFSFFVVMGLIGPLKHEGYELPFRETCVETLHCIVPLHQSDEKSKLYEQSAEMFRYIIKNGPPNVVEWRNSLENLVYYYILQRTTENEHLKNREFTPLFGSMLNTLLKA